MPQKGVKFALAPACAAPLTATTANAQSFQATQQLQEIFDLCAAIQKRVLQQQACLGWLKDDRDRRHALYPRGAVLKQCAAKSLHEVLPGAHGTAALSRGNRLRLAVNISKSVLQLYRTPWLLSQWTTHDIRFIQTGKEPSYEDAFICRDLSSSHSQPTSTKKAPFIRNETLFALGILLIELCFGRFIEDFRTADDFTGTDYMSRMLTMYTIASRLLEQRKVFKEAGARYEYAVHRCIHCSFNHLTADLDDDEFCEAVYDEVVRRLEEDLQNFSGSIDMETDLGNS